LVNEFLPSRFDHSPVHPDLTKGFEVDVQGVEEYNIQKAKDRVFLPPTITIIQWLIGIKTGTALSTEVNKFCQDYFDDGIV